MTSARERFVKKLISDLESLGVTTKSITSEDGSSLTVQSAREIRELLELIDLTERKDKRKIRFLSTRPPGAY